MRTQRIIYDARALEALEAFKRSLEEELLNAQTLVEDLEKQISDVEGDIMEMEEDRIRPTWDD